MKTLAIDFGDKRIGLAISDPGGRVAVPSRTLARSSDRQVIDTILELMAEGGFERVVLGIPLGLDGRPGEAAARVRSFGRKLDHRLAVPLILRDEALTSVEAERLTRGNPGRSTDALAAQILLQEVLAEDRLKASQAGE